MGDDRVSTMTKLTISRWGESAAIIVPQAIMDEMGLREGDTVELNLRDGRGVVERVPYKLAPPLAEMVAEMDRLGWENEPETVDWGPDVGSERFCDHH